MTKCKVNSELEMTPQELQRLAAKPLFKNVPVEQLACFLTEAYIERFAAKTPLLEQHHHTRLVMILLEGSAKVYLSSACRDIHRQTECSMILSILGPGEILGEMAAIDSKGHSATVETLETTRCLCIPHSLFDQCLQEMPGLSYNLLHVVVTRMRHLTHKTGALSSLSISGRLAYHLLSLAERYGELDEQGSTLLPMRLTQNTLAGLASTSREHINKKLAYFKAQKYLAIDENLYISLHNSEGLRRECQ